MRLFIAIKAEDEVRRSVAELQGSLRKQRVRGRYVPRDGLHITMAFIGEYDDPDAVLEAMSSVSFRPFNITADRTGRFGEIRWAGFSDSAELDDLAGKLRAALDKAGIPFDRKRFRAHITFLRGPRGAAEEAHAKLGYGEPGLNGPGRGRTSGIRAERNGPGPVISPGSMTVDRVCLFRSDRGRDGMVYTELGSLRSV